ncbi:hypothetical protein LG331_09755 [Vreelandella aquamarina]|uniref:DUF7946 domain-containing protein n=1 Tax=Vreelandella aquamarina TaxID=77097 RepID=UPI00384B8784
MEYQEDAFSEDFQAFPFEIRYEGRDSENHKIEMSSLAESLDGFSRIYSIAGHFVATGQYAKQMQALSVRAYAQEPAAKCFSLKAVIDFTQSSQVFSGFAGAIFTAVVMVVLHRASNAKEEMKHLRALFEQQLKYSREETDRMLDTVDRLAESLRPSVKKAISPVGKTCSRIDIYDEGRKTHVMDQAMKDAIGSDDGEHIAPEREYRVIISALDIVTKTCKVRFEESDSEEDRDEDGAPRRIVATITDPLINFETNPYMTAFAKGGVLTVKAKALMREGLINKLYISDAPQA